MRLLVSSYPGVPCIRVSKWTPNWHTMKLWYPHQIPLGISTSRNYCWPIINMSSIQDPLELVRHRIYTIYWHPDWGRTSCTLHSHSQHKHQPTRLRILLTLRWRNGGREYLVPPSDNDVSYLWMISTCLRRKYMEHNHPLNYLDNTSTIRDGTIARNCSLWRLRMYCSYLPWVLLEVVVHSSPIGLLDIAMLLPIMNYPVALSLKYLQL